MAKTRFDMVKQRHSETYKTSLKQGKMDPQMISLCEFVANTQSYFTSSCCSGRIILLEKRGKKKTETFFHRKWHREISPEELVEGFNAKTSGQIWLRVDPFILHIGCRDLGCARNALWAMKNAGVKRGGIMVAQDGKYMIELQGTEIISMLIKSGNEKLVDEKYLRGITPIANKMLRENYARLEKLENEFRKTLQVKH